MNDSAFVSKEEAAEMLGVSLSTFDRHRSRLGLQPAPGVRVKPLRFVRAEVVALVGGKPRNGVLTLPALRTVRAKSRKARAGK